MTAKDGEGSACIVGFRKLGTMERSEKSKRAFRNTNGLRADCFWTRAKMSPHLTKGTGTARISFFVWSGIDRHAKVVLISTCVAT